VKINLNNRSLFSVRGCDSKSFLQSQFSNNINQLSDDEIQFNCYCQHQGKIIGIVWVFKYKESYFLSFLKELEGLIISKLNMFKLMSEVEFEDCTNKYNIYGLINEENVNSFSLHKNIDILLSRENFQSGKIDIWEKLCVEHMIPEIHQINSEKHIPQELNLDINEFGVSFSKGCYPGQEVIARMHYLGKPKRRLFRFSSKFKAIVGDRLNVHGSKSLKSSGQVIRVAKESDNYHFLGVFEAKHINDQIFLNNDQNRLVTIIHE